MDYPGLRLARREGRAALSAARGAWFAVMAVSAVINLLMLTAPIFMLQVYDRVLPSRSLPTLLGLAAIAALFFLFQGAFEILRARMLARIARLVDERLNPRLFDGLLRQSAGMTAGDAGPQSLRDLDTVRGFLASPAFATIFDLPWVPLYVGICFLFHPWIGASIAAGAFVLCLLTLVAQSATAGSARAATKAAAGRRDLIATAHRTAPLITALGMRGAIARLWQERHRQSLDVAGEAADLATGFASASRLVRTMLQSGVLGLGAYLVIQDAATPGVMLAATILSTRALAPIDLAIANWKSVAATRQAWTRLTGVLAEAQPAPATILPPPSKSLRVTALSIAAPSSETLILHDVSLDLAAGSALGIIGPSGSGKSTLARALVGLAQPSRGTIRLDGAELGQWDTDALGRSIGYLPQQVELLDGTIAQNIARFDPEPDSDRILAAARAAGVHDLVLRFSAGYDTLIGAGGIRLSGGQMQRVGLARALYGDPFLLVLDEPNSNLDQDGERALAAAVQAARARGGIAIVIAHRPSALAAVDRILVLNEGRTQLLGPRDEVLNRLAALTRPAMPARAA